MIKLGVIGLNEGNGHPFSFSAMFNGYDPAELEKRCPFELIKQYLPNEHRNEIFIEEAKVTHVWTQKRTLSEDVSRVSLIPNIVSEYTDMIGKVDGVLLARDDPWNHLKMAEPFIRAGIPIFIDKQLTDTWEDMRQLVALAGPDYPIMAGSPMRFTRDIKKTINEYKCLDVKSIHGMSRVSWIRYGHHLFEGICPIWGLDIDFVRSLSSKEKHDIVQIAYRSGMNVILEFIENVRLPIQFTCFSETQPSFTVPFDDFFHGFRHMMLAFTSLVETGIQPIPFQEIQKIAKVILAGKISKETDGRPIAPDSLLPIENNRGFNAH